MSKKKKDSPKTVPEAVDRLIEALSEEDLEEIRKGDEIDFHFGLGTYIRNEFGLWDGNSPLVNSMRYKEVDGVSIPTISHPDNISGKIIKALQKRLRSKKKNK
jgi:Domain of unknown function (DUF6794)